MPLLLAVFLLIVQTIIPAPRTHAATAAQRAKASGVAAGEAAAAPRGDERGNEAVSLDPAHGDSVAWLRDARPLAGAISTRGDVSARTPVHGLSVSRLSMEAAFAASVRVRTLDGSHAVSARGALLPYFPTAPPLRG